MGITMFKWYLKCLFLLYFCFATSYVSTTSTINALPFLYSNSLIVATMVFYSMFSLCGVAVYFLKVKLNIVKWLLAYGIICLLCYLQIQSGMFTGKTPFYVLSIVYMNCAPILIFVFENKKYVTPITVGEDLNLEEYNHKYNNINTVRPTMENPYFKSMEQSILNTQPTKLKVFLINSSGDKNTVIAGKTVWQNS